MNKNLKIFLATPITPLLDDNRQFSKGAKEALVPIIHSLRNYFNAEVFCAIEREQFGDNLMSGEVCTHLDFVALQESDVIIAFPDCSYGVHMELGWASALKCKIR